MSSEFFTLPAPGEMGELTLAAAQSLKCLIYRPNVEQRPDRLLVAVHGISRNYRSQAAAFRSMADRLGVCLIAPLFDTEHFPNYQRLAAKPGQRRADQAFSMLLLVWQTARSLPELKIHLFGYSGGAQFAHRYACLYPERIATLSACSAGWYTLPSPEIPYPYGLKNWPRWLSTPRADEFIRLPVLGLVGELDCQRDASLRKSARLDRCQGGNRIERIEAWIAHINRRRSELGITSQALLQLMPGLGHDFDACAQSGLMLPPIEQFIQHQGG
ncbi:alpha/beta hydrolase [Marinobacterium sp. D7]|uniref:alpha/beta hydrolase n=1 Tax=Marinobacterium ramblicola TaxID=2849041 RepID=UPI001C2D6EF6|nr:alpha/beta hydrolase [Marinobacterium ramblicola]MBV1786826.1 alpha/beta hydrolase [Marinobacterium ramblicola]